MAGLLTGNTAWSADTVRVTGDVEVAGGAALFIDAGTRVEFQDHYSLTVLGRLLAQGSPLEPVLFTTDDPEAFLPDSSLTGCWAGIRFPFTKETEGDSRLDYCVIEYAKNAGDSCRGGALQVEGFSRLTVENSILRRNAADFGGAIYCGHEAAPRITGCLIVENLAFNGGSVLHCLDSSPKLVGCTIADNEDLNAQIFDPAAAIYAHISKPTLDGCILYGNPSLYFEPTQILYGKSYCTRYSDIEGGSGEGVIDADPSFLDEGYHPYSLAAFSPCRDAGPPDSTGLHLPCLDLAGGLRLTGRMDMGAYELQFTSAPEAPVLARLLGAHPNPFNPSTCLSFELDRAAPLRLELLDAAGRRVRLLDESFREAGAHEIAWDGRDRRGRRCASGVYFARLTVPGYSASEKVVLLK